MLEHLFRFELNSIKLRFQFIFSPLRSMNIVSSYNVGQQFYCRSLAESKWFTRLEHDFPFSHFQHIWWQTVCLVETSCDNNINSRDLFLAYTSCIYKPKILCRSSCWTTANDVSERHKHSSTEFNPIGKCLKAAEKLFGNLQEICFVHTLGTEATL